MAGKLGQVNVVPTSSPGVNKIIGDAVKSAIEGFIGIRDLGG
jgi:hypothetical protein